MGQLMLVLVMGMLTALNQLSAGPVVTGESSTAISVQSNHATEKVYRVTGQVLDDMTGKPLGRVKVSLTTVKLRFGWEPPPAPSKPASPRVTVTGSDGQFAFGGVPRGTIALKASKAGYLDVLRPRIGTESRGLVGLTSDRKLVLRLAPAASISGVARNHTGALLGKGGDIALYIVTYWEGWPKVQYAGWPKLDPDGTYRFDDLQRGRYFLMVSPPANRWGPGWWEGKRAVGEVPARYPAPTPRNPSPFFTLHEGEQKRIDLQIPEATLHHVTLTAGPAYVGQVMSANGGIYELRQDYREKGKFETWLPDGTYWPTNRRPGEIDGPLPFEIAGADVSGLHFQSAEMGTTRLAATVQTLIDGSPDLHCGPSAAPFCDIGYLYLLYLDQGHTIKNAGEVRLTASREPVATTLLPGRYAAVVGVQRNLYVESIRSGEFDLSYGPLVIHQGHSPAPIQVEFGQGGKVDGVVKCDGKPGAAYVYSVAKSRKARADFRVFAPVVAKDDGRFEIEGLAPGRWIIFATDAELSLDVHDPADTAYWRKRGTTVHVKAGRTTKVVVKEAPAPER